MRHPQIAIRLDSWAYVQEAMGRALALSCHFYQWAGTCYHKVPITRKIRDFVVSQSRARARANTLLQTTAKLGLDLNDIPVWPEPPRGQRAAGVSAVRRAKSKSSCERAALHAGESPRTLRITVLLYFGDSCSFLHSMRDKSMPNTKGSSLLVPFPECASSLARHKRSFLLTERARIASTARGCSAMGKS